MRRKTSPLPTVLALVAIVFIAVGIASFPNLDLAFQPAGQFSGNPCTETRIVVHEGSFSPAGADGTLTLTVINFGSQPRTADVLLTAGGSVATRKSFSLQPGANTLTVLNVPTTLEEATVRVTDCPGIGRQDLHDLIPRSRISGL